jgi:uncharacterized protein (TIGR03083 family)
MNRLYPYAPSFAAFRSAFDRDYARLREVAPEALNHPVPECPGWTGADVIRHLAEVYLHKAESIRTGVMPTDGWPPPWLSVPPAVDVLDDCHGRLVEQFQLHVPADPAGTWWPSDQTVGFWLRRMAHETAIHRRDAESAAGVPGPLDERLALDGIDEVLTLMLEGDWSEEVVDDASGASVAVECNEYRWTVTLEPASVAVVRGEVSAPDAATVFGHPGDVLLWLWGRGPLPAADGSADAVAELRARLVLATQ